MSRSYLSRRLLAYYGAWQLAGIFSIIQPALLIPYGIGFVLLTLLIISDYRSLHELTRCKFSLSGPNTPELESKFEIQVKVESAAEAALSWAALRVQVSPVKHLVFGKPARCTMLGSEGQVWQARLQATAVRLGYGQITALEVAQDSVLRFWVRKATVNVRPYAYRVMPKLKKVPASQLSEMLAQQRLLNQGSRYLLRGQAADQFYSIRKYAYPDSVRHLDHKKTAKLDQLMTRTFDTIHSHHLILALDVGRSMCGFLGPSKKYDYYLSACLALSQDAFQARDRASFIAFGNTLRKTIARAQHLDSFAPLFRGDAMFEPREEETRYETLISAVGSVSGQRSILIVLSDFTSAAVREALLPVLKKLAQKHIVVGLGLYDEQFSLRSLVFQNAGKQLSHEEQAQLLYAYWLQDEMRSFALHAAASGGALVSVPHSYWISSVRQIYSRVRTSMRL